MNIQEIKAELEKVNSEIDKLNFDENGNAIDREHADKVFAREEELNIMLFGDSAKLR